MDRSPTPIMLDMTLVEMVGVIVAICVSTPPGKGGHFNSTTGLVVDMTSLMSQPLPVREVIVCPECFLRRWTERSPDA